MKFRLLLLSFLITSPALFAQDLYTMPRGVHSSVSSLENLNGRKGQGGKSNAGAKGAAFSSLKAGECKSLLDIRSAGIIQRIWLTISDRSPEMLRGLRLRMYWEDSKIPAVDVPFGDFFCAALKPVAFESALFSNPEGRSFNCYIPMAFKKGARITLTNESGKDLELLFFDVDFVRLIVPTETLYFHAAWHRQQSSPIGQDVELLREVQGKGRFLGVSVGLDVNPAYGHTWWGEGEVKMYIDGDKANPTINGTGAEDYIGTGWFEGTFAHRYQGCLVADDASRQYAFYRFHIPDAIWFYKAFRATLQQIGGWYADDVKMLQAKGVPLKLVSLFGNTGFRGLLEKNTPADALAKADPKDWMNFYRSDDYAVTAYYYVDKP
ncbi:DUF2961 domain-containing protein [Mucilaginibacter sp. BJC16-A38]|uniref:glycoside hydrolase family 172 protein n=1 Tax=Mucilaginibacter phenanthrenivorans TaxID=1234842 RepID=UPI002157F768|nr:glycoside hydrolase family 172 protein [Mucilaginibacter phenanthrenivorans]MCR8556984.1 DUF2961 domain-containing protein [Mucilaginibacter phenanthrenivorans]